VLIFATVFTAHAHAHAHAHVHAYGAGAGVSDTFGAFAATPSSPTIVAGYLTNRMISSAADARAPRLFIAQGTGATAQAVPSIVADVTDVRKYGAKCDGVQDDGPAVQAAVNGGKTTYFPSDGCSSYYLINSTVSVPGHHGMIGPASSASLAPLIVTNASVTTFVQTDDYCSYENLHFRHDGDAGYVIDLKDKSFCSIRDISISANNAENSDALIHFRGSMHLFDGIRLTNCRPNAFAMDNDGGKTATLYVSSINNVITKSLILGNGFNCPASGKGVHIWSSNKTGPRPEGFIIHDTVIFMPHAISLQVEEVLNLNITDSTFDSSTGYTIYIKPKNTGIEGLSIKGGYISTGLDPRNGVCIYEDNTEDSYIGRTILQGIEFSFCGSAIVFSTHANGLTIANNTFTQTNTVFNIQGTETVNITGNIVSGAKSFILGDGANGGPFVIDQNQFPSETTYTLIETSPSKFFFGTLNTGLRFAGWSSATARISRTGCSSVTIPHGLAQAPAKVSLTPMVKSGSFTNVGTAVTAITPTNIIAQVCATVVSPGTMSVTAWSSL
jgi:hypothetical protein